MGNFAVSASDEIISQGNSLLEKLQQPGDKKGDTLKHLFEIVEANLDSCLLYTNPSHRDQRSFRMTYYAL